MDTNIMKFAECVSGIKKNFNNACSIFMEHDEDFNKGALESYEKLISELGKMMTRLVLALPDA